MGKSPARESAILDEAPDHLEMTHRIHVKRPAGSCDSLVYRPYEHIDPIISSHLLYYSMPFLLAEARALLTLPGCSPSLCLPPSVLEVAFLLGTSIFQGLSALLLMLGHKLLRAQGEVLMGEQNRKEKVRARV